MDKQQAIQWLVENVTKWPTKITNMRKPDGWRWADLMGGIYLVIDKPVEMYSNYYINQSEWLSATDAAVKHSRVIGSEPIVQIHDFSKSEVQEAIDDLPPYYEQPPTLKALPQNEAYEWLFTRYWGIQCWPTYDVALRNLARPRGWKWVNVNGFICLSSESIGLSISYDSLQHWVEQNKTPPTPKSMSQSEAFDWLYDRYATKLNEWPSACDPDLIRVARPGGWSWANCNSQQSLSVYATLVPPPTDGDSENITFSNLETYVKHEAMDILGVAKKPLSRDDALKWLSERIGSLGTLAWPSIHDNYRTFKAPTGWRWFRLKNIKGDQPQVGLEPLNNSSRGFIPGCDFITKNEFEFHLLSSSPLEISAGYKIDLDNPDTVELTRPGATKFDDDKPMMHLVPLISVEAVAKVMTFDAKKYAPGGWKKVPNAIDRYNSAMLRHMVAIQKGETIDPNSGLPHIDHIACNAMFLSYFHNNGESDE